MNNDYCKRMIPVGVRMYHEHGDVEMLHTLLNYIEGVDVPSWLTAVTLARNEKHHCPDCGQYLECCGGTCDQSQSEASREERHNDVWLEIEEKEQS